MARTVVALYDHLEHARDAAHDLVDAGFDRERISIIARDADERLAEDFEDWEEDGNTGKAVAGGTATGGILGGIAGVLVGLNAVAIPGIGPILAIGPIAGALAGAGLGAAAGLTGALVDAGVHEDEAHAYAEGVRRGGTLVAVQTDDDLAENAANIMDRHDAVNIDERSANWREEGWERHDPSAEPYTADQIERERAGYATSRRR